MESSCMAGSELYAALVAVSVLLLIYVVMFFARTIELSRARREVCQIREGCRCFVSASENRLDE